MFGGLVETVGTVTAAEPRAGATRIEIASELPAEGLEPGASVAVDGVCLTVLRFDEGRFCCDVVAETLARTTLGSAQPGRRVNLERALRLGDRLGGHLVQGHVDGVVAVRSVERRGDDYRLRLETPRELRRFVAYKGSVALQGVSLTVAAAHPDSFEVALIPATLERTTLGDLRPADRANVEVDLLARYLDALQRDGGQ